MDHISKLHQLITKYENDLNDKFSISDDYLQTGPNHSPSFTCNLKITSSNTKNERIYYGHQGKTKTLAKQNTAKFAYDDLNNKNGEFWKRYNNSNEKYSNEIENSDELDQNLNINELNQSSYLSIYITSENGEEMTGKAISCSLLTKKKLIFYKEDRFDLEIKNSKIIPKYDPDLKDSVIVMYKYDTNRDNIIWWVQNDNHVFIHFKKEAPNGIMKIASKIQKEL